MIKQDWKLSSLNRNTKQKKGGRIWKSAKDRTQGDNWFQHLRISMSSSATTEEENKSRQGETSFNLLYPVLKNRCILRNIKQNIYNSMTRSIMVYQQDILMMSERNRSKMTSTEIESCRRCCRMSRKFAIVNEEIRRKIGVEQRY